MQRLVAALAALTCAVLTLTSCRSDTAAPTTPPTTHVSTQAAPTSGASTASASPSPVDEAIQVYVAYQAAMTKAYRVGGYSKLPRELATLTTGTERRVATAFVTGAKREGLRLVDGDLKVVRAVGTLSGHDKVVVTACLDYHSVVMDTPKGQRGPLMDYARDRAEIRRGSDGRWRVSHTKQTKTSTC